jgi:hypothetical protein
MGMTQIILWSNLDQVMVEENHFMVELTLGVTIILEIKNLLVRETPWNTFLERAE